MKAKYIGPEYEFNNLSLVKGQEYDIQIEQTGPAIVVNGQPVISPNASMIVHINNVSIPYAPDLMQNAWQLLG